MPPPHRLHFVGDLHGHKPSYGLIPLGWATTTNYQRVQRDGDLPVLGPMARTAADLAMTLDLLAGPDEREATAYRLALPPPRHDALKDFRVLIIDTNPFLRLARGSPGSRSSLSDRLAKTGAKVASKPTVSQSGVFQASLYYAFEILLHKPGKTGGFLSPDGSGSGEASTGRRKPGCDVDPGNNPHHRYWFR